MRHPTHEEVAAADHEQICRWWRFLPSPGVVMLTDDPAAELEAQLRIALRIAERYDAFGGMTPETSKKIGWTL